MPRPNTSVFSAFRISARPAEHEALVERHGQSTRIVRARKCPCIKNGKVDIYCQICYARGYLFSFQKSLIIFDENSPHFGDFETFPFGVPLVRGIGVERCLHESQGGKTVYTVTGNDTEKIFFSDPNGDPAPARHHPLRVAYEYSLELEVTNEDSTHSTGSDLIKTLGTRVMLEGGGNPFNIHGDLVEVSRVYNVTQDVTYTVKSFIKNSIVIETPISPLLGSDILEVDYKWIQPAKVATQRIDLKNALMKWGEDFKQGDLEATIPGGYFIGRGDLLTLLTPQIRGEEVIKRGSGQKDEIPQFDVVEILDEIIDEDGIKYDGSKFTLQEYNDLVWNAGEGPAAGKRYSVIFTYRPTYQIYQQDIDTMTNEDKRFPHIVHLRYVNKFTKQDFVIQ